MAKQKKQKRSEPKATPQTALSIHDLNLDDRFKNMDPITEEQVGAMERVILDDGEILEPIVYWEEEKILLYGYPAFEIIGKHPPIKHALKGKRFGDFRAASVWLVEHQIARPCLNLFAKIQLATTCVDYWIAKQEAKKNQGRRNDLSTVPEGKLPDSKEVAGVIAAKIGCCVTIVYNAMAISNSGKQSLIEDCRKGEVSITSAYEKVKEKKPKKNNGDKKSDSQLDIVVEACDVLQECEKDRDVGEKNIQRIEFSPVDCHLSANKINDAKVPEGAIWLIFYNKERVIHVVKKSSADSDTGKIKIKVDAFRFRGRSLHGDENTAILEATHINDSTTEMLSKDTSEFDNLEGCDPEKEA